MKQNGGWIAAMADTLTCEIMCTMSGIRLSRCCIPVPEDTKMAAVCALDVILCGSNRLSSPRINFVPTAHSIGVIA